jgi:hypothetical protein
MNSQSSHPLDPAPGNYSEGRVVMSLASRFIPNSSFLFGAERFAQAITSGLATICGKIYTKTTFPLTRETFTNSLNFYPVHSELCAGFFVSNLDIKQPYNGDRSPFSKTGRNRKAKRVGKEKIIYGTEQT